MSQVACCSVTFYQTLDSKPDHPDPRLQTLFIDPLESSSNNLGQGSPPRGSETSGQRLKTRSTGFVLQGRESPQGAWGWLVGVQRVKDLNLRYHSAGIGAMDCVVFFARIAQNPGRLRRLRAWMSHHRFYRWLLRVYLEVMRK